MSLPLPKKPACRWCGESFIPVLILITILSICLPSASLAKKRNYNAPHNHRGILPQYRPGPFGLLLVLKKSDENSLASGKSVMKQIPNADDPKGGGRAICVQDIDAPKGAVWNQILDTGSYVGKVNKLKECANYFLGRNDDGSTTIKTRMVIGVLPGYKFECYYDHTFVPDKNSLVWSLDYDKTSDFDDVAGHWHLEDHPNKQGCTRVFYGCDLKLRNAVPGAVMDILTKKALRDATAWVKKESERGDPTAVPSDQFHPALGW